MACEMENAGYGFGLVRSTSFGRKRVAPPNCEFEFEGKLDCFDARCLKRQCSEDSFFYEDKCELEDLPQEILVRIVCGVDHDDLKRLFFVSKAIREASMIAKKSHFAYSTPRKTLPGIRNAEDIHAFDEVETPKAPKQLRARPRFNINAKKPTDISVSLFASDDSEETGPRKNLFFDIEG